MIDYYDLGYYGIECSHINLSGYAYFNDLAISCVPKSFVYWIGFDISYRTIKNASLYEILKEILLIEI